MYHFFISPGSVDKDRAIIGGNDYNHIKNVLRMKEGEELSLSDGEGGDYLCEIESFTDDAVVCIVKEEKASAAEPAAKFYLFQGLPKQDKLEMIIQKSVELGAYEIIPVETSRCVVKYDEKKKQSKLLRWQKISESAAKQSQRAIVPEVKPVMKFKEALSYAKELDMCLIPYENYKDISATKEILKEIKPGMTVGIFIGPEGGFDEKEVCEAAANGARQISLGNRILRTETAPLMILSVLSFGLEK